MKAATVSRLNDRSIIGAQNRQLGRLGDLFHGRLKEKGFFLQGIQGKGQADLHVESERWIQEALDDLASKADKVLDKAVFRPLSLNPIPYGVHFVDKLFGAEVFELRGEKDNWQVHVLSSPIGSLRIPTSTPTRHGFWRSGSRGHFVMPGCLGLFLPRRFCRVLSILRSTCTDRSS